MTGRLFSANQNSEGFFELLDKRQAVLHNSSAPLKNHVSEVANIESDGRTIEGYHLQISHL
jgi:hypothetical protein